MKTRIDALDQAIKWLETGEYVFSCNAIAHVPLHTYPRPTAKLVEEYRVFVLQRLGGGRLPPWWEGDFTAHNQLARIDAVKAFREHLLKEGNG